MAHSVSQKGASDMEWTHNGMKIKVGESGR